MFLVNTFLGFLGAQIYDVLRREKGSSTSPVPFDWNFFIKDNWIKIVLSLALSLVISLTIHLNFQDAADLFSSEMDMNNLIYILVGAVPEFVLQAIKKKTNFMQPKNVNGYQRKSDD